MRREREGIQIRLVVFLVSIFALPLCAEQYANVASMLELTTDARQLAMGGASVGLIGGGSSIFSNAAGLAWLDRLVVASGLESRAGATTAGELCASFLHLGVGVRYLDFGEVPETDESGNVIGTFSYRNYAIVAGVGVKATDLPFVPSSSFAERIATGLSVKFLKVSTLEPGSGNGLAMDLPLLLRGGSTGLVTGYGIGLVFENLVGIPIHYGSGHAEDWPKQLRLGASLELLDQVILALDITTENSLHVGAEWTPIPAMSVRSGLRHEGVWMWSLGIGARVRNLTFDCAVATHPYLTSQIHASLTASW